jgi:hypothetical protein
MQQWLVGEQAKNQWDQVAELISEYYQALLNSGIPNDLAGAIITNYAGMLNVVVVQSLVSLIKKNEAKVQGN